jgi:hypothetical protein
MLLSMVGMQKYKRREEVTPRREDKRPVIFNAIINFKCLLFLENKWAEAQSISNGSDKKTNDHYL